jgi:hypothetical protein
MLCAGPGNHLSFRADGHAGIRPDIFEKDGYGWHIANNPGVSIVAVIRYAIARPMIGPVFDASTGSYNKAFWKKILK